MGRPALDGYGRPVLSPGDRLLRDPEWPEWDEVIADVDGVVTLRVIHDGPEAVTTWPASGIKSGFMDGRIQWEPAPIR